MLGDIARDRYGWLFRDNGDGTFASLSDPAVDISAGRYPTVTTVEAPVLLIRDGQPLANGERGFLVLAAGACAKRFA